MEKRVNNLRVSVLFRGSLQQLNGAASVVRMFNDHKEVFTSEGIEFDSMITYDCVDSNSYAETRQKSVKDQKKKTNTKAKIIAWLKETYLGSCVCIEKLHIARAKKLIDYYSTTALLEDILIFHDTFTCFEYLKFAENNNINKKVILIHHNTGDEWKSLRMYYPKLTNSKYYRRLDDMAKVCYAKVDAIVFVSDTSKEHFIELRGNSYNDKLHVIKNGINDIGEPEERDYRSLKLITVGTVNERKNQLNLIKCISKITDKTIHLAVVGEGTTFETCKQFVMEHHMENQVEMLGKRTDVADILKHHNVFILPSLGEGLPIAGIEALRSGLPLILTDVGGNKELIGGNGLLINTDNESIIHAINKLNSNKGQLPEMSRYSRTIFKEKFDATAMIKNYCSLAKTVYKVMECLE